MRVMQNLEIHLVHSCNLTCESCSHYSNQGHKGILALDVADQWMAAWNRRLMPRVFSLLGGEPTIHPNLTEFVALSRRHWPNSQLRIVTNGFFLHRHPDLPLLLRHDPNHMIYISVHHASPEYQEKLQPVFALMNEWIAKYGIRVGQYESHQYWTRRYKGFGAEMEPYEDNNPRSSWQNCPAKYCRQLFEGMLWKCAPLAYLKLQDDKYGLSDKWRPYLDYRALPPDCTDQELNAFFDREEESFCKMCPATPERMNLPLPFPVKAPRSSLPLLVSV
jgi:hypothetical protein